MHAIHRPRYGDWICGIGAVALAVLLVVADGGWDQRGWLTIAVAVAATAAGIATVALTIARDSPSAALLASVAALVAGVAATIALLVDGADLAVAGSLPLLVGAYLGLHDERAPGAPEIPVERRPAP